jgi:hypothetical protein
VLIDKGDLFISAENETPPTQQQRRAGKAYRVDDVCGLKRLCGKDVEQKGNVAIFEK